ncbi:MAG: tRNA (adenine(22)-N(1))-methyltransferase [Culicoidibacterales bacterium]
MKLAPRLGFIVDNIPDDANLIDIAADHGYVALALKRRNPNRKIVVSDIADKPLKSAMDNFVTAGFSDVDFRLGSGLEVIKVDESFDYAIIAGIGGKLMHQLINKEMLKTAAVTTFILQANVGMHLMRRWLYEHNYLLTSDVLIKDNGRIYECIIASKSKIKAPLWRSDERQRELSFHFGVLPDKQDVAIYHEWLQQQEMKYSNKLLQLARATTGDVAPKIAQYQELLDYVREQLR